MTKGEQYYRDYMNGSSYEMIAAKHQTNRNIVAGAIHRHREKYNIEPRQPEKCQPSESKPCLAKKRTNLAVVKVERPARVKVCSLLDAINTNTCKWMDETTIEGTDSFCGYPHLPGKPYCEEHHKRAYVKCPKGTGEGFPLEPWRSAKGSEAAERARGRG